MLPEVTSYLKTHWSELGILGVEPRRFAYLMQNRNRPTCFIFVDGEPRPRFIAKFARTEVNRTSVCREHEMLASLHALVPLEIGATLPRHLVLLIAGGDLAAIETVLPGVPMASTDIFTGDYRVMEQQFTLVYDWLLAFQNCTRQDVLLDDAGLQRIIVNPIAERLPGLDLPADVRAGVDDVLTLASELGGCTFPSTFYHGDMNPTNFLLDMGCITGVVDWEWAGRESLPTMDWFNFIHLFGWMTLLHRKTYPSFGASRLHAIQLTFFTDNSFSHFAREWTARFFAHYGLDPRLTPLLLVHALFKLYPEDAMLTDIILGIAALAGKSFVPC
jgi:hypothetical protein